MGLRPVKPEDAERIAQIYAPYVENTAISFEYVPPVAAEILSRIQKVLQRGYPYIVLEEEGQVLGYAYASAFREREAYKYTCETSIYVDQAHRRAGTGQILYSALLSLLKIQGYATAVAGTTTPNPQSSNFHRKMGFQPIGEFKNVGYKFGTWHSAEFFEMTINDYSQGGQPALLSFEDAWLLYSKSHL